MFTPRMARAKRKGLADYGLLAQRYVESFEQKWVLPDPAPSEELLGAADIQSLSDLGNSYALVRDMRSVRSDSRTSPVSAAATAAPLCPSCLRFSPRKNSSCASSRSCFDDLSLSTLSQAMAGDLLMEGDRTLWQGLTKDPHKMIRYGKKILPKLALIKLAPMRLCPSARRWHTGHRDYPFLFPQQKSVNPATQNSPQSAPAKTATADAPPIHRRIGPDRC